MVPALNIGGAIFSFAVMHGNLNNLQPHPGCTKKEIKIAKWIKIAKELTTRGEPFIARPGQNLRTAQRVFEALPEHKGKGGGKKFIGHDIKEPHCLLLHGINQSAAVN